MNDTTTDSLREKFEAWLKTAPGFRYWNATDAGFAAFCGGLRSQVVEQRDAEEAKTRVLNLVVAHSIVDDWRIRSIMDAIDRLAGSAPQVQTAVPVDPAVPAVSAPAAQGDGSRSEEEAFDDALRGLPLQARVYGWLGLWRDEMPYDAVVHLQELLGPLDAALSQGDAP